MASLRIAAVFVPQRQSGHPLNARGFRGSLPARGTHLLRALVLFMVSVTVVSSPARLPELVGLVPPGRANIDSGTEPFGGELDDPTAEDREAECSSKDNGTVLPAEQTAEREDEKEDDDHDEEEEEEEDRIATVGDGVSKIYTIKLQRQKVPVRGAGETVYYKSAYFGHLSIGAGSRPQRFTVVFDTGSGHLVVPSTMCASETCRAHRRYRRALSPSAVDIDYDGTVVEPGKPRDQITVSFGTGEVTGVFVQEYVCLGGGAFGGPSAARPGGLKAAGPLQQQVPNADQEPSHQGGAANSSAVPQPSQPGQPQRTTTTGSDLAAPNTRLQTDAACLSLRMVAATEMTQEPFRSFHFDGVLGLGLEGLSQTPEFNAFHKMGASGTVTQSVFSVFLADNEEEQSEITFGGINEEHILEEVSWVPVTLPHLGYWQIRIKELRVGDRLIPFCEDRSCRAVVDTGTSLLAVPSKVLGDLQGALQHPASPQGHCKNTKGSDLRILIEGNFEITLQSGDYARPQIPAAVEKRTEEGEKFMEVEDGLGELDKTGSLHNTTGGGSTEPHISGGEGAMCEAMLMSLDLAPPLGPKLFILGEPVLRKYYTVYDAKRKRVGFARAAHEVVAEEQERSKGEKVCLGSGDTCSDSQGPSNSRPVPVSPTRQP